MRKQKNSIMLLAVDIGNSNIVLALYDGVRWNHTFRHETRTDQPALYYQTALNNILLEWGINDDHFDGVVISCVVPDVLLPAVEAIRSVIGVEPLVIEAQTFINLDMYVPLVYEIGADIVCNAYAALKTYNAPCLIVDFGTALTYTLVTPDDGIKGVSIAPGIGTAFQVLSDKTALLPHVEIAYPSSFLGHDTEQAIQSGVLHGYTGMVKYMLDGIVRESGLSVIKIATGGLSHVLTPLADHFDYNNKQLTVDGMRQIYEYTSKSKKPTD
jgi:type III pantothenate kinase